MSTKSPIIWDNVSHPSCNVAYESDCGRFVITKFQEQWVSSEQWCNRLKGEKLEVEDTLDGRSFITRTVAQAKKWAAKKVTQKLNPVKFKRVLTERGNDYFISHIQTN